MTDTKIDGTIVIDRSVSGTTEIRLAGINAPPSNPARRGEQHAEGSMIAPVLAQELAGKAVCIAADARGLDRYGRLLAQVVREDGWWAQGALLRLGMAWVDPTLGGITQYRDLLALEQDARTRSLGVWAETRFQVHSPATVGRATGEYHIVQGRVVAVARRQNRWYLNFGEDWRTDFTVVISKEVLPAFAASQVEPHSLSNRLIRVRGWVENLNGPMIDIQVPEQIEILDALAD